MRRKDEAGQRRFVGVLRGVADGRVNLELDGKVVALALEEMERAKLVPEL
jgi:ribosome maturation factor RimP